MSKKELLDHKDYVIIMLVILIVVLGFVLTIQNSIDNKKLKECQEDKVSYACVETDCIGICKVWGSYNDLSIYENITCEVIK